MHQKQEKAYSAFSIVAFYVLYSFAPSLCKHPAHHDFCLQACLSDKHQIRISTGQMEFQTLLYHSPQSSIQNLGFVRVHFPSDLALHSTTQEEKQSSCYISQLMFFMKSPYPGGQAPGQVQDNGIPLFPINLFTSHPNHSPLPFLPLALTLLSPGSAHSSPHSLQPSLLFLTQGSAHLTELELFGNQIPFSKILCRLVQGQPTFPRDHWFKSL